MNTAEISIIGHVSSPIKESCYKTLEEWASVKSILHLKNPVAASKNDTLRVIYFLDRITRTHWVGHPKGDLSIPEKGIFLTHSPSRPNHLAFTDVKVVEMEDNCNICVCGLDALDETPILSVEKL